MKRYLLSLVLICFIISVSDAQIWRMKRYEAGIGFGPSFFFGDVGGFSKTSNIMGLKDLSLLQTRFDIAGNIRYRISQTVNVRFSINSGLLRATDVRGSNEDRGYEASIHFIEPTFTGEYYFIKNKAENSWLFNKGKNTSFNNFLKSLDFYAFTGIGGLSYSVSGNNGLENAMIKHSGFAFVVPVGLGSSLIYTPNVNFGIEIAGRYSFSDNIDGYTSQYSSSNDVYYFFNFTITYKLKTGAKGWPSFR